MDTGFYDFHIACHTVNQQSRDYAHALMSATDGYGKAAHAYKSRPYPATHHPHRAFGTVNTSDPSPDDRAVQSSLGRLIMALLQHDEVSRNSFVRFPSMSINSDSFALIQANTTNWVGFS